MISRLRVAGDGLYLPGECPHIVVLTALNAIERRIPCGDYRKVIWRQLTITVGMRVNGGHRPAIVVHAFSRGAYNAVAITDPLLPRFGDRHSLKTRVYVFDAP